MSHGLDNDEQVFFYEQEFYVLSNFSAFQIEWKGLLFPTSEHVYHWEKFNPAHPSIAAEIIQAKSPHDAFQLSRLHIVHCHPDWEIRKVPIMEDILWEKVNQHEYVKRKLLQTGGRELIENSWRDNFWGWGPEEDGRNMLGRLWERTRDRLNNGEPYVPGRYSNL